MSMIQTQEQNVPALRFPEFSGEWVDKYLGSICNIKTGKKDTKDRVDGGEYPFFVRSNTVERIDTYSYNGEAILTSGDGVGVGKNFHYINGKFDFHQRVYSLRKFEKNTSGEFVFNVFSDRFYRRVIRLSAKNSVDSVRMDMIFRMMIAFPSLPEQQKIASFLSSVDHKIEQLAKKKQLLEQYKKGLMQNIFSGEFRFKDAQGNDFPDWEKKRLGEVATFAKGKGISKSDIADDGVTPCIRYGQLYTQYAETISSTVSKTNVPVNQLELSKKNDVIIPASGETALDIATASCVTIAGVALGGDLNIIRSSVNGVFLAYYLNSKKKLTIACLAQGISVIHLYAVHLRSLLLTLPSIEEQQKIADFLSAIDRQIDLVATELSLAKTFKKGLLQQMFV